MTKSAFAVSTIVNLKRTHNISYHAVLAFGKCFPQSCDNYDIRSSDRLYL